MRIARSLIVSPYLIVSHTCPPGSNHAHPPAATTHPPSNHTPLEQASVPPPWEQPHTPPQEQPRTHPLWTEWQTGVKILPCPKLRLRAVIKLKLRRESQFWWHDGKISEMQRRDVTSQHRRYNKQYVISSVVTVDLWPHWTFINSQKNIIVTSHNLSDSNRNSL